MTSSNEPFARGIWKVPQTYEAAGQLPVIRTLRTITAALIRDRIQKTDAQSRLLSIGIGNGLLYQTLLLDALQERALRVLGVDVSNEMLEACAKNLPGLVEFTDDLGCETKKNLPITLSKQDIVNIDNLRPMSLDIIEAVLVLHHIPYSDQLRSLFNKTANWLKKNGVLIIGDIDVNVGSYLENKENHLRETYQSVKRDSEGYFLCDQGNFDVVRFPLLDPKDKNDNKIIKHILKRTCQPLREEARLYSDEKVQSAIEDNISCALKGLETHRTISEWRRLVADAFNGDCTINILKPADIRKAYPQVLDSPFILVVTKK